MFSEKFAFGEFARSLDIWLGSMVTTKILVDVNSYILALQYPGQMGSNESD